MNGNSTLRWVFLGIAFLLAITFGFKSCKKESKESERKTKIESKEYHWKIEKTVKINFTSEYGEIRKDVLPGDMISFENSTEPYCVKNKVGEYCGKKGEDVGSQIPNSTNNGELRFKSQNEEAGSIDIIFWVWSQK